jgi:hypothetical protein
MALRWIGLGLIAATVLALSTFKAFNGAHADVRNVRLPATLTWRPPTLVDPITLRIGSAHSLELDPARDYILELPRDRPLIAAYGCIHIAGGHNIVLIGGECHVPLQTDPTEGSGRAFSIEGNTGTVHIEGLAVTGPGLTEGIDVFDSPRTVLQVENCRFATIHNWGNATIHSDLIQADLLAQLRVDRLTGSSQVQGIFRDGPRPAPDGADLRHVNIAGVPGGTAGRLLWNGAGPLGPYPLSLTNVYIRPFPGHSVGADVWPGKDQPRQLAPRKTRETLAWPAAARIIGTVHAGRPPGGDFVPNGVAGVAYVSPGYSPG